MSEQRWPGEEGFAEPEQEHAAPEFAEGAPDREEPVAEVPEDGGDRAVAEAEPIPEEPDAPGAEADAVPVAERLDERSDGDIPVPEEAAENALPAEEDELPRAQGREHAADGLSIPDGFNVVHGSPDGGRRSVGLVVSRFNGEVTKRLLETALDELEFAGIARDAVTIVPVPGAFELPLAAMALAKTRRFACIVALGCVIRGETPHFDYVASEAASGLQLAALETGIPVSFGVLTLETPGQAEERVGKGAEAVRSALEMADLFSQLRAASG